MLLFFLLSIAAPTVLRLEPIPGNASQPPRATASEPVPGNASQPPRATAPEPVASEELTEHLSEQEYSEDLLDQAGARDASEQLEECLSYKEYCEDLLDRAEAREKSFSDALDETVLDLRACKDVHENLVYWITSPELERHQKYEALVKKYGALEATLSSTREEVNECMENYKFLANFRQEAYFELEKSHSNLKLKYNEIMEENDFLFDLWWNSEKEVSVCHLTAVPSLPSPNIAQKAAWPPAIETRTAVAERVEEKLILARDDADTRASRESVDALRKMARRAEDKVGIGFPSWERVQEELRAFAHMKRDTPGS